MFCRSRQLSERIAVDVVCIKRTAMRPLQMELQGPPWIASTKPVPSSVIRDGGHLS